MIEMTEVNMEYRDKDGVCRRRLSPPILPLDGAQICRDECALLSEWFSRGKIHYIRSYARLIHMRVWDEHVDVLKIWRRCAQLLDHYAGGAPCQGGIPARSARKPNADEQSGDLGDIFYGAGENAFD